MYRDMNNCLECGRLVAPTSGMRGADINNLFCCRKCLRAYYDSQPGLWEKELKHKREMEEAYEQHLLEEEQIRLAREFDLQADEYKRKEEEQQKLIIKIILYIIFFIFIIYLFRSFD